MTDPVTNTQATIGTSAFGSIGAAMTVAQAGDTLNVDPGLTTGGLYNEDVALGTAVTLSLQQQSGAGAISFNSLAASASATVQLGNNLTVGSDGLSTSFGGTITGSGSFTKAGSGTLVFTTPNSNSGGTIVSGGTLQTLKNTVTVPNNTFSTPNLNGGFAYATSTVSSTGTTLNNSPGVAWTFVPSSGTGGSGIAAVGSGFGPATPSIPGVTSTQLGFLQKLGTITQSLTFATAGNYTLTFYSSYRSATGSTNPIKVYIDGTQIGSTYSPPSSSTYTLDTISFTVASAGAHTLQFAGTVSSPDVTSFMTDVLISAGSSIGPGPLTVAGGATFDMAGNSETITSLSGAGTITNSAASTSTVLSVSSGPGTFSGVIQNGNSPIALTNTGTLILSGANTFTGATTVTAGALFVNGSDSTSSAVTVSSGATLASTGGASAGTIGTVSVSSGGYLGTTAATGILDTSALTLASGSTFSAALNGATAGTSYSQVNVTGAATITGATLNLSALSGLSNGTFTLLTATGGITGTFAGLPAGSSITSNGDSFAISYNTNSIVLTILHYVYVSSTWAGDTAGTNVTSSFLTNGNNAVIGTNAFATVGAAVAAETSSGPVVFVNPGTYSESVAAGSEPITITLQGGAISFTSITDSSADPLSIVISSGATWTVGSGTLNGGISGTGSLIVGGPGSLTFLGSDIDTSAITVNSSGALQIGTGGSLGSTPVVDNGSVIFNSSTTATAAGAISGTGSVIDSGGTLKLTGSNTYSGATTVSSGTLIAGAPVPAVANYPFNGNTNDYSGNGFNGTLFGSGTSYVTGPFAGQQALRFTGSQTVHIPYNSAFALNTYTISAWFNLASAPGIDGILGTRFGGSDYTFDIKVQSGYIHADVGSGSSWINTSVNETVPTPTNTWEMVTYVINNATHTAYLYYNGSQITTASLASGTPLFMTSGETLEIGSDASPGYPMNGSIADVYIFGSALSTAQVGQLYANTLTSQSVPANSPLTVNSGATVNFLGGNQPLASLSGAGTVTNASLLTVGSNNLSSAFSGTIQNGTSALALTKVGTGTLTLSGANTYTGTTTVSAGTLLVTGSISSSSPIVVSSGGTFSGSSGTTPLTIGTVSVSSGGTLGSNSTSGILDTAALTLASGSTLNVVINNGTAGSGYDQVNVTGSATITGATLNLIAAPNLPSTGVLTILTATGSITGTFSGLPQGSIISSGGQNFEISYTANSITLTPLSGVIYVSSTWAGDANGTNVTNSTLTGGSNALIGTNAFATIGAALGTAGVSILVNPGTYNEAVVAGSKSVTITMQGGAISVNSITDTAANPFTLLLSSGVSLTLDSGTIYGSISGSGGLVDAGPGSLTLVANNFYSGGTTVNSGATLQVGNGGATGSFGAGTLTLNGTLAYDTSTNATYAGNLGGSAALTQAGSGTLKLTGTNSYTGATTVSNGTLTAGALSPAVAYYPLNGNTNDYSGNGFNGTISGSGTSYVAGVFGGEALNFTGYQNVAIPYNSAFALNTFTVSAWFNIPSSSGTNSILGTRFGGEYTFDLKLLSSQVHGDIGTGSYWINTNLNEVVAIPTNSWHMVTYVINNATQSAYLYFDTTLEATISLSGTPGTPLFMTPGETMEIGNDASDGYPMNGAIDDVYVFGSALTSAQVSQLYQGPLTSQSLSPNSPVTVAGGATLSFLGGTQTLASLSGAGTVTNASTLVVGSNNQSTSFSGVLENGTSPLALSKVGTGSFTLSGTNTYTGATTVSGGSLIVNGTLSASSAVTVASGAALSTSSGATPASVGNVSVNSGGILGSASTTGILDTGSLTLSSGADFDAYIQGSAAGSGYEQVNASGPANISGATLNLTAASGLSSLGVLTILSSTSGITGTFAGLPQGSILIANGTSFEINYSTDNVTLTALTGIVYVSSTWAGDAPGTTVTDPVLTGGSKAVIGSNAFATVDAGIAAASSFVIINPGTYSESVAAGSLPLTLALQGGAISFNSITDTAADPLSLVLSTGVTWTVGSGTLYGAISGPGNMVDAGPGQLTLLGTNINTGSTTINAGATLQVGNGGTAGTIGTGSLTDNGNLTFDNSGNTTITGGIGGSGALTQAGAGTLTLSGTDNYSGATTISAGTLQLTGTAVSAFASNIINNGALLLTASGSATLGTAISGGGTILLAGPGSITLSGPGNTDTGLTTVAGGTLTLHTAGGVAIDGNLTIGNSTTGSKYVADAAASQIAPSALVTINSDGELALSFNESFGSLLGSGPLHQTTASSLTLTGDSGAFSGSISGGGNVFLQGSGTYTLSGSDTSTGTLTISSGTLDLSDPSSFSSPIVNNAALSLNSTNGNFTLNSVISGTGTVANIGAGTVSLSGSNTYSGSTTVSTGTLQLNSLTNAVAYYPFNGNTNDYSGNGFNGTIAGGGTSYVSGPFGGQALNFTGYQTVNIPYNPAFALNTYTVSAWVDMPSTPSIDGILGTRFGGEYTFDVKVENGKIHGDVGSGSSWIYTSVDEIAGPPVNSWHMVTYVIDDATQTAYLYYDANLITTISIPGTPLFMSPSETLEIGSDASPGYPMRGAIADVYIFGSALSGSQVTLLYGGQSSSQSSTSSPNSAVTVASGATLALTGGSQSIAALSGAGTVTDSASQTTGVLTVGNSSNLSSTFSGVIQDGAGMIALIKTGTGSLTLTGPNTFSGPTTVTAGALIIGNSDASSPVTIYGGVLASMGGANPATVGSVTVNSGGTIGSPTAPGIIDSGTLTLTSGSDFDAILDGATPGSGYSQVNASGSASIDGATLNFTPAPNLTGGSYTILSAAGGVSGTFAGFPQGSVTIINGQGFEIDYSTTAVTLLSLANLIFVSSSWAGDPAGTNVTDPVLTDGVTAKIGTNAFATVSGGLATGSPALIINRGTYAESVTAGSMPVTLLLQGGPISFKSITDTTAAPFSVLLSTDVTWTVGSGALNGAISGGGNLSVAGPGTFTLLGNDTFLGTVAVASNSTLNVGSGGTLSSGPVTDNGSLVYDSSANVVVSMNIGGRGTLTQAGSGQTTLTGYNTYSGGTSITGGILQLDNSTLNALGTGPVAIANGATVDLDGTYQTVASLSGNGSVIDSTGASSTLTINGTLTPGSAGIPGILTMGSLSIASGGSFDVALDGAATPGTSYSQLDASGAVNLTGASLDLTLGYTPTLGDTYDILQNTSGSPIVGNFNGLTEGSTITLDGYSFIITYLGGPSGNDVVLTDVASTSLNLTSSDQSSAVYGETLTLTAVVNPIITGTVTFTDTTTQTVLGYNIAVDGTGTATIATSALAVGSHIITAVFTPTTAGYGGSTASLSQTIALANTTTSLTSSENPSNFGDSVTFTATATPVNPGAGTPTGTVSFYDSGALLMTESMNGGVTTYITSTLAAGSHSITAVYSGDSNFNASSTSTPLTQVVISTTAAPSVSGVVINPNQGAVGTNTYLGNSRVLSIQVNFNEPVDISSLADAFTLTNIGIPNGGASNGYTMQSAPTSNTAVGIITVTPSGTSGMTSSATLTFSNYSATVGSTVEGGSLTDGLWSLSVSGVTSNGTPMSSSYSTPTGSPILRLFGDYTGARVVTSADLGPLGTTYGLLNTNPAFIPAFDVDGNGEIDSTDLGRFGQNFGLTV